MPFNKVINHLNTLGSVLYEHTDAPGQLRIRRKLLKHCREYPSTYQILEETGYHVLVRKV